MSNRSSKAGRWVVAVLVLLGLLAAFYNLVVDNMPKGEVRRIDGYTPWPAETVEVAETLPVQNGGRIKPFSSLAGFNMLGLHGARSMKIEDADGKTHKLSPTEWMLDALFRPRLAVQLPTFRVDNSAVLEAIGVKPLGRRDRYSYADLESGRAKLLELGKKYEEIEKEKRDPMQQQTIDLAYNLRNFEALLGYFSFARSGVVLHGSGGGTRPDQRAEVSTVLATAPQIRSQLALIQSQGKQIDHRLQAMLEQVLDAANFAKFGLFILPPESADGSLWKSAGNAIMDVMTQQDKQPATAVADIKALEKTAHAIDAGDEAFRTELSALRDRIQERSAGHRGADKVALEATYYRKNWFLNALALFLVGTLSALAMWGFGRSRAGRICSWITWAGTLGGLVLCIIAIVKRCVIMQRPPVGNLYDTIIFIAATGVLLALVVEWMVRRRFALGLAPMLGTLLILLARRYELGDAKDHMDPLVAVLDSNFWLTFHVITITLGYSAGLLSAKLSTLYLLVRGLRLDGGDRDFRRSLTRAVYGMLCLTLFLSLVGTVLGGIWANYSWGRFWGWDPKENGALMIVLWTLAILHARLGGYLREWGLHLASVFTACIVAFSWWHVNFLGVGLHNYGFTAGKNTIWAYYGVNVLILAFGVIAMVVERSSQASRHPAEKPLTPDGHFPPTAS